MYRQGAHILASQVAECVHIRWSFSGVLQLCTPGAVSSAAQLKQHLSEFPCPDMMTRQQLVALSVLEFEAHPAVGDCS